MRLAIVIIALWASASSVSRGVDISTGRAPRSHIQPVGEIVAAERATPWTGIVTARAPEVLRQQFQLDRGAGLVIESVAPGSVAERAGLRRHDVIVAVDGQLLLLPEQFVTLLEASGDDAPLECRVLRGGVEHTFSLRTTVARSDATPRLFTPAGPTLALVKPTPLAAPAIIDIAPGHTLRPHNSDYDVKLTGGTEHRLVVKDTRGRIIFNGPIDTPEQRSLVPPEVRSRVEELERLAAQQQAFKQAAAAGRVRQPRARLGSLDIDPIEIR